MQISEILAEVLVELCNEFETVKLYNVRGNHDRVTPNKKDEIAKESFNDLVPWYLKARLSHVGNLEFVENKFDDEIIVANILGHNVFGVHGHKDKVANVTHNLTMMTKIFPEYIVMGHTHHHEENEDHGVEVIVNRCFSGVDDYAKELRRTSKAAQKLIIFDKHEGRLCSYDIKLEN
jgi:predicted phosphodiesterase